MIVEKAAVRKREEEEGGRRREKKRESTRYWSTCKHEGTGFHALKYLSVGSIRARRNGCAGGSPKWRKEGSLFSVPSIEGERAREPRGAHLSLTRREVRVLKAAWCG